MMNYHLPKVCFVKNSIFLTMLSFGKYPVVFIKSIRKYIGSIVYWLNANTKVTWIFIKLFREEKLVQILIHW